MIDIDLARRLGLGPELLAVHLGNAAEPGTGARLISHSPIDGHPLAQLAQAAPEQVASVLEASRSAFGRWRQVPAPVRGEFVRRFGNLLRAEKEALGELVTLEVGKIRQEGQGEVQEMIDICDFAVGLSRQLDGKVIASERRLHRLTEQWHPLGPVGVITAFNFPVAVWAWNAALAWVCGDSVVWKPSEKAPLCALACQMLVQRVILEMPEVPSEISSLIIGGADIGAAISRSHDVPLVSATGSVRMGRIVAETVAHRLGRSLLELGGNNALVLTPSADKDLALRAAAFSAVGTAGQRCTSLRRLIAHHSVADDFSARLLKVFGTLAIGDPRSPDVLLGPLIDEHAYEAMRAALEAARAQGGRVHGGERVEAGVPSGGIYVRPALVEIAASAPIVQEETFAPILYLHRYDRLEEAIAINNQVRQGLSSSIFTRDLLEAELFCCAVGSDCGIANVNVGTSGAEIGAAFGGEKETGGGRESGSDAWKVYMRRATNTVNFGTALPLAQGIRFDLE
jgi:aldehyde dehydrogenase (NAD+)